MILVFIVRFIRQGAEGTAYSLSGLQSGLENFLGLQKILAYIKDKNFISQSFAEIMIHNVSILVEKSYYVRKLCDEKSFILKTMSLDDKCNHEPQFRIFLKFG